MINKKELTLKEMVDDDTIKLENMYNLARDRDLNWDNVNDRYIIEMYIADMMKQGIRVSHMLEALESTNADLFEVWLGNSMETPTPIKTKQQLMEALE